MAGFYLFLSILFGVVGALAIAVSIIACCSDGFEKYQVLIALGGIFLIGCSIFLGKTSKEENAKKPVVVSTKSTPQIDTTITISNGVADTVYTYYLIKE